MKLMHKALVPTILLLLGLVVFLALFARHAVEEAVLLKELERMEKTSQNALLPEVHLEGEATHSEESTHEEEEESGHEEGFEGEFILNQEDFEHPSREESQRHFFRYLQEFKDPEIEKVTLWSKKLKIISSSNDNDEGLNNPTPHVQKILSGADSFFVKKDLKETSLHYKNIAIFVPLKIEGKLYGVLEICLNTDEILAPVKKYLDNIVFVTISAGAATLFVVYLLNNYFIGKSMQLARNKEDFFAIASHEMRTPLTSIKGSTSTILTYYPEKKITEAEMLDFVKQAHDSSVRLIGIANDYIDTLRLEQGKSPFKTESVDIVEIINSVVAEVKSMADEKGLSIKWDSTNMPKYAVLGDKDRVRQVVYNLATNAIHYTRQGSITITIENDGKNLKTVVADTGIGIDPENQKLLFQKFQQAGKNVLSREASLSVGVGLYICKLLVENMKGKVGLLKSEVGKGSEFYFSLPLADNK